MSRPRSKSCVPSDFPTLNIHIGQNRNSIRNNRSSAVTNKEPLDDRAIMSSSLDTTFKDWAASLVEEPFISIVSMPSNEINQVFRLAFKSKMLFLKIGPCLQAEYQKLQWLYSRQPSPNPYGFQQSGQIDVLLMSAIPGVSLAGLKASLSPSTIVVRLAVALQILHATDIADWPFDRTENGTVLVHGDACLPNILYDGDTLSGYIDIGDMRIDTPEVDLAAAVWSLQYNLGPGYGLAFLQEYGIRDANEKDVERLRRLYEES